jgi:hypothetical protein
MMWIPLEDLSSNLDLTRFAATATRYWIRPKEAALKWHIEFDGRGGWLRGARSLQLYRRTHCRVAIAGAEPYKE